MLEDLTSFTFWHDNLKNLYGNSMKAYDKTNIGYKESKSKDNDFSSIPTSSVIEFALSNKKIFVVPITIDQMSCM